MAIATLRILARSRSLPLTAATLFACSCLAPAAAHQTPPQPSATASAVGGSAEMATPARRAGAIVISGPLLANRTRLSDVLAEVPGLRVVRSGLLGAVVASTRAPGCTPDLYLDRLRVGGPGSSFDVDAIAIQSVDRIEIYPSFTSVPHELGMRDARCGVVIIRTRTR